MSRIRSPLPWPRRRCCPMNRASARRLHRYLPRPADLPHSAYQSRLANQPCLSLQGSQSPPPAPFSRADTAAATAADFTGGGGSGM